MPTLTIQLAGLPPVSHVLKDETITIGRMKGNTIVIDDASISLSHAKITRKNGKFFLKDLNSTNGTLVNGQSISDAPLKDRDRVLFAEIQGQFLEIETAVADAAAPVPIPVASQAAIVPALVGAAPVPILAASQPVIAPAPVGAASLPRAASAAAARAPAPRPAVPPVAQKALASLWRGLNSQGQASRLAACVGALAVVTVVALAGWRMMHLGQKDAANKGPGTSLNLAAAKATVAPPPTKVVEVREIPALNSPSKGADPILTTNEQVAKLVADLKSEDAAERRQAATGLHSMGPEVKEALPALKDALRDTDSEVRMWAALTLINNKCYDKATIPVLVSTLQHENPVLRQVACLSLGLMPYDDAEKETVVPALAAAAKDADDEVRKAAISALDIIAPETVAKAGLK